MSSQYKKAVELIDAVNSKDPNIETNDGKEWPKELLYSHRMSDMIERYASDADDVMKLAIRAQHIERWKSLRSEYPEGRKGYFQWRTALYTFHAERAAALLAEAANSASLLKKPPQAARTTPMSVIVRASMVSAARANVDQFFFDVLTGTINSDPKMPPLSKASSAASAS